MTLETSLVATHDTNTMFETENKQISNESNDHGRKFPTFFFYIYPPKIYPYKKKIIIFFQIIQNNL